MKTPLFRKLFLIKLACVVLSLTVLGFYFRSEPDNQEFATASVTITLFGVILSVASTLIYVWKNKTSQFIGRAADPLEPPGLAEVLLGMFAPNKYRQSIVVEFAEEFELNLERVGARRAKRLAWIQVARTLGPLALNLVQRKLKKFGKHLGILSLLAAYLYRR